MREGVRKGVIWHTQGSGKTALAYSNVQFLTDYFSKEEGKIAKFYFIVDRLDLAEQAKNEFEARGLKVKLIKDKEAFITDNIEKVHPHKFRRTLATVAIDKGMPIEQLQKLLGHQRIDTTLQYAMVKQSNVKIAHRKYIG